MPWEAIDMKSGLWIIVAVATVSSCGGEPLDPLEGVEPAQVVSSGTAPGATPMFSVAPTGERILSWVSAPDGGSEGVLNLEVTTPEGGVTVSQLVDPLGGIEPHGEAPPQVAAGPDGEVYALYTVGRDIGARFPVSALRFARSEDLGQSWSDPITVNEGEEFGSHNFHALLAGSDGTVHASWLNSTAGQSGVWLRTSLDGGATWQPSHPIHLAPTCPCCRTGLALGSDGTLYASWRKIFDNDVRDVVVMASADGGTNWREPVRPRVDGWVFPGCPHAGPSIRADGQGNVHIAWWTGKAGEAGVWYGQSHDQGITWQVQPLDTAARATPAHVQLALTHDNGVVVAWDDGLSELPRILMRASPDGGQTFRPVIALSEPGLAASYPVLALHHDTVSVAWSQTVDGAYRAALAARRPGLVPASSTPSSAAKAER